MVPVPLNRSGLLAPLFRDVEETMAWSFLQGCMGRGAADRLPQPRVGRIVTGDFCFLAGDADSPDAERLAETLWEDAPNAFSLLIPPDRAWLQLIERVFAGRCTMLRRYAFRKTAQGFNIARLRSFAVRPLPPGFRLVPVGAGLYRSVQKQAQLADLCSQFPSYLSYKRQGRGFAILHRGRPVCGASSYTVFKGGIEIEIDTLPGFRRRGFATVCAAALMLSCLEDGLYPSWDAANPTSCALAEKLGYRPSGAYTACLVTRQD